MSTQDASNASSRRVKLAQHKRQDTYLRMSSCWARCWCCTGLGGDNKDPAVAVLAVRGSAAGRATDAGAGPEGWTGAARDSAPAPETVLAETGVVTQGAAGGGQQRAVGGAAGAAGAAGVAGGAGAGCGVVGGGSAVASLAPSGGDAGGGTQVSKQARVGRQAADEW
jgi:hypothetical protein